MEMWKKLSFINIEFVTIVCTAIKNVENVYGITPERTVVMLKSNIQILYWH